MADLARWVFRSPGRFAVVAIAALAVLLVGSLAVARSGAGPSRPATTDVRASTPAALPSAAGLPHGAALIDVAQRFTQAWAVLPAGSTAQEWRKGLQPLVTADLMRGLALTDAEQLPQSPPSGTPTLRFLEATSGLVRVPLANGEAVLVTVVADGPDGWVVADVQPDEGDTGLSPGATP